MAPSRRQVGTKLKVTTEHLHVLEKIQGEMSLVELMVNSAFPISAKPLNDDIPVNVVPWSGLIR